MSEPICNRNLWEFEYTARNLADAAIRQRDHRLSRVKDYSARKQMILQEIKESGIEVNIDLAEEMFNYKTMVTPKVGIRSELRQQLAQAHEKIVEHQQAAVEYDGWVQVLCANPEARLKLTHSDWLYFFGKQVQMIQAES